VSSPHPPPSSRRTLLGVATVAGVVLLQLLAQYVGAHDAGRFFSVLLFLALEMPPLMLLLSAIYRSSRQSMLRVVLSGLLAAGAIGAVFGVLFWQLSVSFPGLGLHLFSAWPMTFDRVVMFGFTNGVGHFGLWALAFGFPVALEDARVRALEAETLKLEAEKLRAAAELARLRSHLEPHFLLNTLNAIAGLVTEDAREARRLIVALGDLLRDALKDEDELEPLEAQVQWLSRYASILEARHRGDLTFRWDISPESRSVLLPRLLLQPLVENAVKHGALKRHGGGEVVVRATLKDGNVVCTVEDNGPGMPADIRDGAFGLQSVRRRLELKYPQRSSFKLESTAQGTRSIVEVAAS
jgi:signal transduction histidine kinase